MKSPTARTLAVLKGKGYRSQVVEKHNTFSRKKIDLFGFIDLIYLNGGIVGVQCTSGANHAARRTKILSECREAAIEWLRNHGVIEIRSWSKLTVLTKKGKKVKRWSERIEEVSFRDFGITL